MRIGISILNNEYVDTEVLRQIIIKIKNTYELEYQEEGGKISLWQNNEDGSSIGLRMNSEESFLLGKEIFELDGYSSILLLSYFSDDQLMIPFLKEFVKNYPNILIYNDEGLPEGSNVNSYVYSKVDIDNIEDGDNDYWSLLGKAPAPSTL